MNIRMELAQIDKVLRRSGTTGKLPVLVYYREECLGLSAVKKAEREERNARYEDLYFYFLFYGSILTMSTAAGALCAALLIDLC